MPPSVWALLLLAIAIGIVALELFIPSGGLLGILAAASMVASIVVVFKYYGLMWGTLYLVFNAFLTPFVIVSALKWWPHTPIGRKMLNLPPGEAGEITSTPSYDAYKELMGQRGIAESKMLPSGTVQIGEVRYDAVGQGVAIDPGQHVEVVAVEGNRIIVRPVIDGGQGPPVKPQDAMDRVIADPFDESDRSAGDSQAADTDS
jgi:membrane-bound serine protease (ClpP class)